MAAAARRPPRRAAGSAWAAGVDAGATWVRVLVRDSQGRSRSAALRAPASGDLVRALGGLWRRWGLEPRAGRLLVAARGCWTAGERARMARRLHGLAARVRAIADVEAAHAGALQGGPGVLVLSGTGAIVLGRDGRGRWRRAGGLGPLLGDEGSGFWIARQWLRARAERDLSGVRPFAAAGARRIATLAPAVLARAARGQPEARRAVSQAQEALAGHLVQVARGLRLASPVAVSWAGSLMGRRRFREGVWRAARRAGLGLTVSPPRLSPAEAALEMAEALPARSPRARARAGRPRAR